MPDLTAKRTLVKSPPELWSELSEVERLARHLGAFGGIRITKLEPEHTVAWEGESASGTVSIEPSGWGTKVTLTAQVEEAPASVVGPEAEPSEPPGAQPEAAGEPAPEGATEPQGAQPEAAGEPAAEGAARTEPAAADPDPPPKRGFLARLFGRGKAERESRELSPAPEAAPPADGTSREPSPAPEAAPPADDAPEEHSPAEGALPPDGPSTVDEAPSSAAEPPAAPSSAAEPTSDGLDPDRARAILDEALDALGSAHHRPFSRG